MDEITDKSICCNCAMNFNPQFVAVQLFDTREGEYFNAFLTELTKEDIAGIKSGLLEIVENEDVYDRYIRWRTMYDESFYDGEDENVDSFIV